jgi:hypothetical protein
MFKIGQKICVAKYYGIHSREKIDSWLRGRNLTYKSVGVIFENSGNCYQARFENGHTLYLYQDEMVLSENVKIKNHPLTSIFK